MSASRRARLSELGELQLEVFEIVCELAEASAQDVRGQFPEQNQPHYSTVMTVLRRLEEKGLLSHRTEGRTYIYHPTREPEEVRRQVLRDIIDRVFGGSPKALVAELLGDQTIDEETLEELKAMVAELEGETDDG